MGSVAGRDAPAVVSRALGHSLFVGLALGLCGSIVLVFIGGRAELALVLMVVPSVAVSSLCGKALVGAGHTAVGGLVENGLGSGLAAIGLIFDRGEAGIAVSLAVGWAVASTCAAVVAGRKGGLVLGPIVVASMCRPRIRESLRRNWVLLGMQMSLALAQHGQTLVVITLVGPFEAGVYAAVQRVTRSTSLLATGLNSLSAGTMARLSRAQDCIGLLQHLKRGDRQYLWAGVLGFLVLAPAGLWVLDFTLGGLGLASVIATGVLLLGGCINIASGPGHLVLQLWGEHKVSAGLAVGSTILGLTVGGLLALNFGIRGAALAEAGSIVLSNVGAAIVSRRLLATY